MSDSFEIFEPVLAACPVTNPWQHQYGEAPVYSPDYELLEQLLTVPVRDGSLVVSGRFALGIDAWLAHELRRVGFGSDEVWPRTSRPRILPRDIAVLLEKLPARLAAEVRQRLLNYRASRRPRPASLVGRTTSRSTW